MEVDMNADEYCEVDSNLTTFDSPNDEEILKNILFEEGLVDKISHEENKDEEYDQDVRFVTREEGENAFNTFRVFSDQFPSTSSDDI